MPRTITSPAGDPASRLGLAGHPEQDPRVIARAFRGGINYFFFYGPDPDPFGEALVPLVRKSREKLIVASGSGSRSPATLRSARRKILEGLGTDSLDIFFAEYIHPADKDAAIFGPNGVLEELAGWKSEGTIRFVGATAHDRALSRRLAGDPRVDVLMQRYNMAHRKAGQEVFPEAIRAKTPIVAFTATRWKTLLVPHADWPKPPPTAADCYRYCVSHPAVKVVLTAPKTVHELDENLAVLRSKLLSDARRASWERFGDLVYGRGGDPFDTQWE